MKASATRFDTVKKAIVLVVCGTIMGFAQAYGCAIIEGQGYYPKGPLAVLPIALCYTVISCAVLFALNHCYLRWKARDLATSKAHRKRASHHKVLSAMVPEWSWQRVTVTSLVVFLLWLPWGIALFPGSMNWDTFYQISSWYAEGHPLYFIPWAATESFIDNALSDHHPIFDTFFYGLFAKTSDYLFDTWNYGVFAFLVIQAFGLAASLSGAIAYLRKKEAPLPLCFGLLLFIALFPPLPIYAFTMLKDTFFCFFFIPWFLMLASFCMDPEGTFTSKRRVVCFVVLSVLLCLAKKTGLYIVLVGLIAILIHTRRHWKVFVSAIVSAIVVMQVIIPCIAYPLFDVAPGGKQEMLGPMFQQTARYVNEYPSEASPEEARAIDAVLGYERLKDDYSPFWMDKVKFGWNWDASAEEMAAYYGTWIQQGLRHPDSYFEAIFAVNAGYVCSAGKVLPDVYLADESSGCWDKLHYPPILSGFQAALLGFYDALLSLPVLGLLFKMALYSFWLPMAFFFIACNNDKRLVPLCAVLLISLIACLIGPVYQTRYAIAFIFIAPLLVGLLLTRQKAPISRPT